MTKTDFDAYLTSANKKTGIVSVVDRLLDRLGDDAETVVRSWLADEDVGASHCCRAMNALAADMLDNHTPFEVGAVTRWRSVNQ